MEREGFVTTRLFVAASFIVFCVLAVAVLGTAAWKEKGRICGAFQ